MTSSEAASPGSDIPAGTGEPPPFDTGVAHQARTAWRRDDQVGLAFEQSFDLTREAPLHLKHMQRLWIELAPR